MSPQSDRTPPRIQILPPHVVNRIAAGEVVERPASVVKELVENALDAGATRIDVIASAAGRNLRVADNGCGMSAENAALAFYNHATSKIQDESDLSRIDTLGFRGEALASIGSIARVTCLTRTADADQGIKVTLDAQGEPTITEAGCAPGTILEVSDLFYNTPARLKFLKRPATELGHIEETLQALALSHPEVRFSLTLNDKQVLHTSGSGELRRTLDEVFHLHKDAIRMLPITAQDDEAGLALAGFASEPGVMKSSKRWLITFVNGRTVRCPILQKALEAAYESLLPHGKHPVCVLFLNMPPDEVDVNVHPTKREIRYAAAQSIFGFVRSGIRESLSQQGIALDAPPIEPDPTGAFGTRQPEAFAAGTPTGFNRSSDISATTSGATNLPRFSPNSPVHRHHVSPEPVQAAMAFYTPGSDANANALSLDPSSDPGTRTALADHPSRFKVVGQLFNTYILLETTQGLMVVDQHIASERAFFETLTLNLTQQAPDTQQMITAPTLPVSPVQSDLLRRHQPDFARLGFTYELRTGHVQLTSYPLIYAGRDGMFESGGQFEHLLAQLEETGEMKLDLDHLIATLACHSAVRAGDPLSPDDMQAVIERWLACKLPWTCPHGRPIAHTISKNELNHFFHRPSLPASAL